MLGIGRKPVPDICDKCVVFHQCDRFLHESAGMQQETTVLYKLPEVDKQGNKIHVIWPLAWRYGDDLFRVCVQVVIKT